MALPARHDVPIIAITTYDPYCLPYVPDLPHIPYEYKHLIGQVSSEIMNQSSAQAQRNPIRMLCYNLLVQNLWNNDEFREVAALAMDRLFEFHRQYPNYEISRLVNQAVENTLLGYASYLLILYPDLPPLYPNRNALNELFDIGKKFNAFVQDSRMRRQGQAAGMVSPMQTTQAPMRGYPQMQARKLYYFNYNAFVQVTGLQLSPAQIEQIESGNFNVSPAVNPEYFQNFITPVGGAQINQSFPQQTGWTASTGGQTRFQQQSVSTFGSAPAHVVPGSAGVPGSTRTVQQAQEDRWKNRSAAPKPVMDVADIQEIQHYTAGGFEEAIPISHKRINLSGRPEPEPAFQKDPRPIRFEEEPKGAKPAITIELPHKKKTIETTGGSEMDRSKHKIMIGGVYPLDTPSRFQRFANSVDKFAEQVEQLSHPKPETINASPLASATFDSLHDLNETGSSPEQHILTEEEELRILEEETIESAIHPHYLLDSNVEDCITSSRIKMLESVKEGDDFVYTVPCIVVNPIATTINVDDLMAKIGPSKDLVEYALNCRSLLSRTSTDSLGHETVSYLLTVNSRLTDIVSDYLKYKLKTGVKIDGILDDIGDLSSYLADNYGPDYASDFDKFSVELCANVFREQDEPTMKHIEENLGLSEGISVGTLPIDYTITHTKMLSMELGLDASVDSTPVEVNVLDVPILYKLIRTLHRYKVEKQMNTLYDLLITSDGVRYKIWWDHFMPVTYYICKYTGL